MPVLAVCRGSQVLNVARGGDLVQHLPEVVGDEQHEETPGVFADHDVTVEPGTRSGRCSATARRSSRTITRASAASARGSGRSRGPRTARSRRSRTRTGSSPSACSGIPRRARTHALFQALVEQARDYRALYPVANGGAVTGSESGGPSTGAAAGGGAGDLAQHGREA